MFCNQGINQDLAERFIKNAWENKRLALAYLFLGPAGTGRLFLARCLAKTVNCQAGSFPPCGICPSCLKIDNNNHPDIHYIQKQDANFIRIEQIQQIQKDIFLRPFEGKCKVFIIFNAEDLTPEAANRLLRILEDPPTDSLIILIASDLRRIFSTIISRCQKILFHAKDPHQLELDLNRDHRVDKKLSHFLAFVFEGRLGQALEYKDRDTLREKNQIIRNFLTNPNLLMNGLDYKDKDGLKWILKILISCVRDIYLLKNGVDRHELINEDIKEKLLPLTKNFSFNDLYHILNELCQSLELLRQNMNPRLLMDNLQLLWKR